MMYGYGTQQIQILVILGHFLPFHPSKNPKIKILKKWKKMFGDIIISHLCTTNDNQKMYGFKRIRQNQVW